MSWQLQRLEALASTPVVDVTQAERAAWNSVTFDRSPNRLSGTIDE